MTIGIAIPLKAKAVSKNWDIVERNLYQTLLSLKNQSVQRFHAVVVGHDCPSFLSAGCFEGNSNITFLKFDEQQPPLITADESSNQIKFENDRCGKIYKGYLHLVEHEISHFFPLDADDLVSKEFIKHIFEHAKNSSVLIERGYVLYKNKNIINEIDNFSTFCGSSFIASIEMLKAEGADSGLDNFLFKQVGHVKMRDFLESTSANFFVPEERLALYVRDNGENISRHGKMKLLRRIKRTIKLLAAAKFFKSKIKNDFSLVK